MAAAYEGSGASIGYVAHRDNIPTSRVFAGAEEEEAKKIDNDRGLTALLYANEVDWSGAVDGGALRCFVGAAPHVDDEVDEQTGEGVAFVDVEPLPGRLVLFRSRDLLHRVMPVKSPGRVRVALSAWLLEDWHYSGSSNNTSSVTSG